MVGLYEFLEKLYEDSELKDEIDFDQFIDGFLDGTFNIESMHEGFFFEDFICNFNMDCKIDHDKKEIKLLFKER